MKTIRSLLLVAIASMVVAGAFAWGMSGDSWRAPSVVRITSDQDLTALLPSWAAWHGSGAREPQGLLLRDGDVLIANDTFARYAASDGQSLTLTVTDWSAKIGDKIVSVTIDKNKKEDGIAWLNAATDRQLADLRTLAIKSEIDPSVVPALNRLAAINASLDVSVESDGKVADALALFHPRNLFAGDESNPAALKGLDDQPQLEGLLLEASEPGALGLLPKLPNLKMLMLNEWDPTKTGPLPEGLRSLTSLAVLGGSNMTNLAPLQAVGSNLEELSLLGVGEDKAGFDLTGVEKMKKLHTLAFFAYVADPSPLDRLDNLRWILLPLMTQTQFASFAKAHPKLAILDLSVAPKDLDKNGVTDLSPLAEFKSLQGLILGGPYESLAPIRKLTTLRFVGISKKTWDANPAEVNAIRKALPDALVVRVAPFCLGSGWILLLVPVPVVAWWVRQRRSTSAARVGRAA